MNLIKSSAKQVLPAELRHKIRMTVQYGGSTFECNCCGGHWRKLVPRGRDDIEVIKEKKITSMGYRLNSQCPNCFSIERDRLLYWYLKHETTLLDPNQPVKVLHIAPEYFLGHLLKDLSHVDYLSTDLVLYDPLVMETMDVNDIQYSDHSFDVVFCNHVMEHIPDDRRAMSEIFRVLKPGGWAVLLTPISYKLDETYEDSSIVGEAERERAFGQNDHVRIYGPDYKDRLASVGFDVKLYTAADHFTPEQIHRLMLWPEETLYIGHKPD